MSKKITTATMIEMIRSQKGTTFATIKSNTDAGMKKSCPIGEVRKVSHMNVMIGFDYSNAVNNQRSREEIEAEFQAAPRRWGKRVDLKTVEHNDKVYLTTATLNHYSTEYQDVYGEVIPTDYLKPHMKAKSKSSRQGTEKEIVYRDFTATNITEITMMGETYEVS